jgi:hypothetical protein
MSATPGKRPFAASSTSTTTSAAPLAAPLAAVPFAPASALAPLARAPAPLPLSHDALLHCVVSQHLLLTRRELLSALAALRSAPRAVSLAPLLPLLPRFAGDDDELPALLIRLLCDDRRLPSSLTWAHLAPLAPLLVAVTPLAALLDAAALLCARDDAAPIYAFASAHLAHESALVRAAALACCAAALATPAATLALASSMLADTHAVVRRAAMRAIEARGDALHAGYFALFCRVLRREDDDAVRRGAAHCVAACARVSLQLRPAAFVKLCDAAINDGAVDVRAACCRLLGDFADCDTPILMQCFDKKLLTSAAEPRSGTALQIEGDVELAQDDRPNVEAASAAGAFVHALEDEYAAVRGAAVESITRIALRRPQRELAERATTNLVDAFNDEIEPVRLRAIVGVRCILRGTRTAASGALESDDSLALSEEFVLVALSNLEEASERIRDAIRALLCGVRLETPQCLLAIVQSLLLNIARSPEDTPSVLQCLRRLGRGHPALAEQLVDKLLRIDRRFAPQEPHIDDLYYACIMVLLLNAAVCRPSVLARLPSHCAGHAAYLRLRFGALLPTVGALTRCAARLSSDADGGTAMATDDAAGPTSVASLAEADCAARVNAAVMALSARANRVALLSAAVTDLQRIAALRDTAAQQSAASAGVRRRCAWLAELLACVRDAVASCDGGAPRASEAAARGFRLQRACERLRHAFAGVGSAVDETLTAIHCLGALWCLFARCSDALDAALDVTGSSAPISVAALLAEVRRFVHALSSAGSALGGVTSVLAHACSLSAEATSSIQLAAVVLPALQSAASRYDAAQHAPELRKAATLDGIVRKTAKFTKPAPLVVNDGAAAAGRSAADVHADAARVGGDAADDGIDDEDDDDDDDDYNDVEFDADEIVALKRARSVLPAPQRVLDGVALHSGAAGSGALFFTDLVGSSRRPALFHRRLPLRIDLAGTMHHVDRGEQLAVQVTITPQRQTAAGGNEKSFVVSRALEASNLSATHGDRVRFAIGVVLPVAPLLQAAELATAASQQMSEDAAAAASASRKLPPVVVLRFCIVHRVESGVDVEIGEPAFYFVSPR